MQEDALFATMTPLEAIFFSGMMRTTLSKDELMQKTDFLIKKLGLEKCSDTLIGNELIKGLSGGQRKLTSVAVEVIANPKVSFSQSFSNIFLVFSLSTTRFSFWMSQLLGLILILP